MEFELLDGSPDGKRAKRILQLCADNGLLILPCGPYDNVLRLIPPLILTESHVAEALKILCNAIDATAY
jgi:4-aminobutyrate aminotransferase-like enzyme